MKLAEHPYICIILLVSVTLSDLSDISTQITCMIKSFPTTLTLQISYTSLSTYVVRPLFEYKRRTKHIILVYLP